MKLKILADLKPVYWSVLIFIIAQICTFIVISHGNQFLEENQIYIPEQSADVISIWPQPTTTPSGEVIQPPVYSSLGPILIYFLAVVVILGIVLFVIPLSALKMLLRALFAFLFGWALFIILALWLPWTAAIGLAVVWGLAWFFFPRVWLHNIAMVLAMVAVGSVFGRMLSPWTAMILLVALSIYDFVAVRFGYMIWMVKKMSDSNTLPAFFIPKSLDEWKSGMKGSSITRMVEETPAERKFSILGGGDIAFPLLLVASIYFTMGFGGALVVAFFSLAGLLTAYWIQARFLKGNAMPALPPIAALSLIGLLICYFSR